MPEQGNTAVPRRPVDLAALNEALSKQTGRPVTCTAAMVAAAETFVDLLAAYYEEAGANAPTPVAKWLRHRSDQLWIDFHR